MAAVRSFSMKTLFNFWIGAVLLGAAFAVAAFDPNVPPNGLPSASDYGASVLPDIPGVISWRTLAQVEPIKRGDRIVPQFSKAVLVLDGQQVRVQGFMQPLDRSEQQRHFLLLAAPPECPFCLPASPDAIVEVFARKPFDYGYEPIVVSGKLLVLKDDPSGLLYRLGDAVPVAVGGK